MLTGLDRLCVCVFFVGEETKKRRISFILTSVVFVCNGCSFESSEVHTSQTKEQLDGLDALLRQALTAVAVVIVHVDDVAYARVGD